MPEPKQLKTELTQIEVDEFNELITAGMALYQYASVLVECTCKREFAYHGKIVHQCRRCQVMERYELACSGTSERKTFRETSVIP